MEFSIDVEKLQWSHHAIFDHFSHKGADPGVSVFETVVQLLLGQISPRDLPTMRVTQRGPRLYSLANRRLFVLRTYQQIRKRLDPTVKPLEVNVQLAPACSCSHSLRWMFTTENTGMSVELLRPSRIAFDESFRQPCLGVSCNASADGRLTEAVCSTGQTISTALAAVIEPEEIEETCPREVALTAVRFRSNPALCIHCPDTRRKPSMPIFQRASELARTLTGDAQVQEEFADDQLYDHFVHEFRGYGPPWDKTDNWYRIGTVSLESGSFCAVGVGASKVAHERSLRLAVAVSAALKSPRHHFQHDMEFQILLHRAREALMQCSQPPITTASTTTPNTLVDGPINMCFGINLASEACVQQRYEARVATVLRAYVAERPGYLSVSTKDFLAIFTGCTAQPGEHGDRYEFYVYGTLVSEISTEHVGWLPADLVALTSNQCWVESSNGFSTCRTLLNASNSGETAPTVCTIYGKNAGQR